jgi:hypothetical protein
VPGPWPKFGYVELVLDSHDPPLDANVIVATLPSVRLGQRHSTYSAVWGNVTGSLFRPEDQIGLTLVGRRHANYTPEPFIQLIGKLATLRLNVLPDPQGVWTPQNAGWGFTGHGFAENY